MRLLAILAMALALVVGPVVCDLATSRNSMSQSAGICEFFPYFPGCPH